MGLNLTPRQQTQLSQLQSVRVVPSRPSVDSPWYTQDDWNANVRERAQNWSNINDSLASHNRLVNFGRLASMAPLAFAVAPGGVLAAGGGGASSAAAPAVSHGYSSPGIFSGVFGGSATAPVVNSAAPPVARVGLGSRLGAMFNSAGMKLGVNSALSLVGMRSQNKANDQARADTLAANREALALQRQQIEAELRNADLDRADAKAANDAMNELKRRELAAADEERQFQRSLLEQREARLAPIRQRGQQALDRLAAMWSLG